MTNYLRNKYGKKEKKPSREVQPRRHSRVTSSKKRKVYLDEEGKPLKNTSRLNVDTSTSKSKTKKTTISYQLKPEEAAKYQKYQKYQSKPKQESKPKYEIKKQPQTVETKYQQYQVKPREISKSKYDIKSQSQIVETKYQQYQLKTKKKI